MSRYKHPPEAAELFLWAASIEPGEGLERHGPNVRRAALEWGCRQSDIRDTLDCADDSLDGAGMCLAVAIRGGMGGGWDIPEPLQMIETWDERN